MNKGLHHSDSRLHLRRRAKTSEQKCSLACTRGSARYGPSRLTINPPTRRTPISLLYRLPPPTRPVPTVGPNLSIRNGRSIDEVPR